MKSSAKRMNYKLNSAFEILTPTGFKDFKGMKLTSSALQKTITFKSGKQLK